ncbi:MAG: hypothetical protein ABR915_20640, partial [Thermoguttaceae bacterium]
MPPLCVGDAPRLAVASDPPTHTHEQSGGKLPDSKSPHSTIAVIVLLSIFAASAPAAEPPAEQQLALTLAGGAGDQSPMVLDLTLRGDNFEREVWAVCLQYNLSRHHGSVVVGSPAKNRWKLSVQLTLQSDPIAPGGPATYEVELTREGEQFQGTFTGVFLDRPVKGTAAGRAEPSTVRTVADHKPLVPGEHPRLIFRKHDLAELRRRMGTPEGQAIMAMLAARSPLREVAQVSDRHSSWMAANFGALWQLTGQKDAPRKAREILASEVIGKPMPHDRKDIHHASRLLGIALAYDLCYDAWDEEFRQLLAEYIQVAALELGSGMYEGFAMDAKVFDPDPARHRNASRMACAGLAALAVLGDTDTAGQPLAEVDRLARLAERQVLHYLRAGITQSGVSPEGATYKDFALANGVLQFLQASRVARGRDLTAANRMLLAGNVLAARLEEGGKCDFGLASISIQASGLWPIGLGSVPRDLLPAMRWCFDRDVGLAGKQHFGCAYPYQAAYVLANYPFDLPAKSPAEALPLVAPDNMHGHFLLRNRWQDAGDAMVELYLNLQSNPPLRLKTGDLTTGVLNVSGFGETWIRGFVGPPRLNETVGAELLYCESGDRCALVGMDLTPAYTVEPQRGRFARVGPAASKPTDLRRLPKTMGTPEEVKGFLDTRKTPNPPSLAAKDGAKREDERADPAVRMVRHIAIDVSGQCGAPVLVALVDRCEGLAKPWRLPLA